MPLVLIMPRYRRYQQGDIVDEKDEERMTERYSWAVAEITDAQAEPLKPVPHDPERKADETAALEGARREAVNALLPKLKPLAETKTKKDKPAPTPAARPPRRKPGAEDKPMADSSAEEGEND